MQIDGNAIIVAILGSGAFASIVTAIINALQKRKDAKSGVNQAVRLILKDRLRYLCLKYIEQGYVYADELEDLLSGHKIYHNTLGGNGYLDVLIDNVKRLPVRGAEHH